MYTKVMKPQVFPHGAQANPRPVQQAKQQFVQAKQVGDYQYQTNNVIGKGYSSFVYKGLNTKTQEAVSLKVIDMHKIVNPVQKHLLENEIRVLRKLQHRNILELKDVIITTNNTYIITEYCNEGDLNKLLVKEKTIPERQAKKYLYQVLQGYQEIAKKNILHRDFKPSNIFLKDQVIKIADFGFAIEQNAPKFHIYHNVGSPNYMCPQSLETNNYNFKSDIWGIGVLYYEILYGDVPWDAPSEDELIKKIMTTPPCFHKNVEVSELSKDFIRHCLCIDEKKRFDVDQLLQHPLFNSISDSDASDLEHTKPSSTQPPSSNSESQVRKEDTSTSQMQITPRNSQSQISEESNKQVPQLKIEIEKPGTQEDEASDISTPTKELKRSFSSEQPHGKEDLIYDNSPHTAVHSLSFKKLEEYIICDLYFCKFLNRIYKLLLNINIIQSPYTKEKIQHILLKNIVMKMVKLEGVVKDQRLEQTNLNAERLTEKINKYLAKFRDEFYNFHDNNAELQKLKQNLGYERGFGPICNKNTTKDTVQFYDAAMIQVSQVVREINYLVQQEITKLSPETEDLSQPLQQKIILLDYLITLYQLYTIITSQFDNQEYFVQNSKLDDIVQGCPGTITRAHHQKIRNKIYVLNI